MDHDDLPSLDALQEKINATHVRHRRHVAPSSGQGQIDSGSAMAMRCAADLVAGAVVGGGAGYLLDSYFDTKPFLSLICLLFGVAGGFLNVWRTTQIAMRQDTRDADTKDQSSK